MAAVLHHSNDGDGEKGDLIHYLHIHYNLSQSDLLKMALEIARYMASYSGVHGSLRAERICVVQKDDVSFLRVDPALPHGRRMNVMNPSLPPEGVASVAGDVWAFGVLLWEIFSRGKGPEWIRWGSRENLAELEDCGEDVQKLIQRCCSRDPAQRPTFDQIFSTLHSLFNSF